MAQRSYQAQPRHPPVGSIIVSAGLARRGAVESKQKQRVMRTGPMTEPQITPGR